MKIKRKPKRKTKENRHIIKKKVNVKQQVLRKYMRHLPDKSCDYVLTNTQEIDILSRFILDFPNIETGGQLFGYWTFDGKPVILYVLGPGPNASHRTTFFMQDLPYLRECARVLKKHYGLDHIGEWHSHHQLGLTRPSLHDANNISTNMCKLGYSKFLLCIGTCTNEASMINAFMFDSSKPNYECIPWNIKSIKSPFRTIIKQDEGCPFCDPNKTTGNMVDLLEIDRKSVKIEYGGTYWLKKNGASQDLKSLLDWLNQSYRDSEFVPTIDSNHQVHIEAYFNGELKTDIHFPMGFPNIAPIITPSVVTAKWNYNTNILESFIDYYRNINSKIS